MPILSAVVELDQRIFAAVRAISHGQIASYGGVATQIGLTRGARRVARALGNNHDASLPWHRVLRAGGRIAFAKGSAEFDEQARRLVAEGHQLRGSQVVVVGLADSLDAQLWG